MNKVWIMIILLIIVVVTVLSLRKSNYEEVDFFVYYTEGNQECNTGNIMVSCYQNVSFDYKNKEYNVTVWSDYAKPQCQELNLSINCTSKEWDDNITRQDGKIKIKGLYNKATNTLINYTIL